MKSASSGKSRGVRLRLALLSAGALAAVSVAAQEKMPSWEAFGHSDKLQQAFVTGASKAKHWEEPAEPVAIAGPVYFVGTRGLGAYLITTDKGHILLNTAMQGSGPEIAASIRKLGFKPEDVRILLTNHGHVDHVAGHAHFVGLSNAAVYSAAADVEVMQSGGAKDYFYGNVPAFRYDPVHVDKVLKSGDRIRLGGVELLALETPGHSRAAMTFVLDADVDGKKLRFVFPDGTGVNPGYRLLTDPNYLGIADDYHRTFATLSALKPDIWLSSHTEYMDFDGKREMAKTGGVSAWIDPEGYRAFLASQREAFDARITAETSAKRGSSGK